MSLLGLQIISDVNKLNFFMQRQRFSIFVQANFDSIKERRCDIGIKTTKLDHKKLQNKGNQLGLFGRHMNVSDMTAVIS